MPSAILHDQAKKFHKKRPELAPGFTVRVHERIREGEKERVQIFEGLIISLHNGHTPSDASFTVRRIASGVGVERVFPVHSPMIDKIEVKKVAKVRRAKLFFLRGRTGKSARMSERFTSADEFAIAVDAPEEAIPADQHIVEAPVEEASVAQAAEDTAPVEETKE
jgi:large subunit ribosomal protein L19